FSGEWCRTRGLISRFGLEQAVLANARSTLPRRCSVASRAPNNPPRRFRTCPIRLISFHLRVQRTGLLNRCGGKTPPLVRIPSSPFFAAEKRTAPRLPHPSRIPSRKALARRRRVQVVS